jgi:site-specific DNA-cytosine methylase
MTPVVPQRRGVGRWPLTLATGRGDPLRRQNPDWGGCPTARRPVSAESTLPRRSDVFKPRHRVGDGVDRGPTRCAQSPASPEQGVPLGRSRRPSRRSGRPRPPGTTARAREHRRPRRAARGTCIRTPHRAPACVRAGRRGGQRRSGRTPHRWRRRTGTARTTRRNHAGPPRSGCRPPGPSPPRD